MAAIRSIGAVAGYRLEFSGGAAPLGIPSTSYHAQIEATLPDGLDGGASTIAIEGLSEADHAELVRRARSSALVLHLHLFWSDAPTLPGSGGDTLVSKSRVTAVKRRAGTRRYETVVEAREWVYDRLLRRLPTRGVGDSPMHAALLVCKACGIPTIPALDPSTESSDSAVARQRSFAEGELALEALRRLGRGMEQQSAYLKKQRWGLGMYSIRDGGLRVGPDRLDSGPAPTPLDEDNGLLSVERRGDEPEDPAEQANADAALGELGGTYRRDRFELTLRGRPDLKPGDLIDFPVPEIDGGSALSFTLGAAPTFADGSRAVAYVRGVIHRLNREQGFTTIIRCVSATSGTIATRGGGVDVERLWFRRSDKAASAMAAAAPDDSSEGLAVWQVRRLTQSPAGRLHAEVAQVRAHHVTGDDPLRQRVKVRRGLVAPDGGAVSAARLPFDERGELIDGVPYATPFAWGRFGLVLPKYPGTRILLAHRQGAPEDPIDMGALWEASNAPPSLPGDYWLILPAGVSGERREVTDDREPALPSANATHDLIDAEGTRIIEVGKLTVRIGAPMLGEPGTRPTAAEPPVSIEHASGTRIVIDEDGSLTIEAKKKLTLRADEGISIDTPEDVIVTVGGVMDVKART